ncbi:MAG: hypothetical protein IPL77_06985 [Flavobacteriales bacterium]|nr:hypothetical protein [Flavobacteriales bacterium]
MRIGLGSGIPMGGYALLDDVGIGGIPTGLTPSTNMNQLRSATDSYSPYVPIHRLSSSN